MVVPATTCHHLPPYTFARDRAPDTPHPFLDNPSAAPLGWGLNRGHYDVRLTGQDCERGTFGQRHAVLWDQQTGTSPQQLSTLPAVTCTHATYCAVAGALPVQQLMMKASLGLRAMLCLFLAFRCVWNRMPADAGW